MAAVLRARVVRYVDREESEAVEIAPMSKLTVLPPTTRLRSEFSSASSR